jgi:hypothetical protein
VNARSAVAVVAVAALTVACGSDPGPGKPYGLREVERSFHEHGVDTGRFGDQADGRLPSGLSAGDLSRDVLVGFASGRPVSVWVFSTDRAAKRRARFGRKLEPPVRGIREGNVIVGADWPYLARGQRRRIRAALADLE